MPRFTRTQIMDIAKIVRNTSMADCARRSLISSLANLFKVDNVLFDERIFRQIATGQREDDLANRKGIKREYPEL